MSYKVEKNSKSIGPKLYTELLQLEYLISQNNFNCIIDASNIIFWKQKSYKTAKIQLYQFLEIFDKFIQNFQLQNETILLVMNVILGFFKVDVHF